MLCYYDTVLNLFGHFCTTNFLSIVIATTLEFLLKIAYPSTEGFGEICITPVFLHTISDHFAEYLVKMPDLLTKVTHPPVRVF